MTSFKTLVIFGIAILTVGGISGTIYGFSTLSSLENKSTTSSLPFAGHVELIAAHSDGAIYAYRQTDNTVVAEGKTCVGALVFGNTGNATSNNDTRCAGGGFGKFQFIGIGTGTTASATTDLGLEKRIETFAADTAPGLLNGSSTAAQSIIDKAFTIANGTNTIGEIGLFDNANQIAGHMFARQALSTGIPVNNGDVLTVKWTINIG